MARSAFVKVAVARLKQAAGVVRKAISLDKKRAKIVAKIEAVERQIRTLLGEGGGKRRGRPKGSGRGPGRPKKGRKKMSAAARRKMSAARKKWWAAKRAKSE